MAINISSDDRASSDQGGSSDDQASSDQGGSSDGWASSDQVGVIRRQCLATGQ